MTETLNRGVWVEDGFGPSSPRRTLVDWRAARNLTQADLAALSGLSIKSIQNIEAGNCSFVRKKNRAALARALRTRPGKLILPGDLAPAAPQISVDQHLRAELRDARRTLHKAYDFMVDDQQLSWKGQDTRDALLPEIQRELKGT